MILDVFFVIFDDFAWFLMILSALVAKVDTPGLHWAPRGSILAPGGSILVTFGRRGGTLWRPGGSVSAPLDHFGAPGGRFGEQRLKKCEKGAENGAKRDCKLKGFQSEFLLFAVTSRS